MLPIVRKYKISRWGQSLLNKAYRHAKMNVVIARGLKLIRELKMGTPSSERIIEDVDLALEALNILYRASGAAVEGLSDRNVHRRKLVGEGNVSVGGVHKPKVRGTSANSTKQCPITLICLSYV